MSGDVVADKLRLPGFVPFLKHQRHTWQLCLCDQYLAFNSETTQLGKPRKKEPLLRSVVAVQDLTVELATACARNQVSTPENPEGSSACPR